MAIQIKRGLEAQRGSVTFKAGELVYTTDEKKLYVGDGTTAGGIKVFEELYDAAAKAKVDFISVTAAVDLDEVKSKAEGAVATTDIIDDLTSGGSDKVLSAEQGKVLKSIIDSMAGGLQYQGTADLTTNQQFVITSLSNTSAKKGDFYLINGDGNLVDTNSRTLAVNAGDMIIINKDVELDSLNLDTDVDKIDNTESDDILRTINISAEADFDTDSNKLATRATIKTYIEEKLSTLSQTPVKAKGDLVVGESNGVEKRLAIGSEKFLVLRVNEAGDDVEWGDVEGGEF